NIERVLGASQRLGGNHPAGQLRTQVGYDEMVKVLAGVWSQEAASIAQEIKRLP
ncbi:hypothetical protein ACUOBA_44450, partial [Escherichia coli]